MLVVMGEGSSFFNDVWAFDLERETWRQLIETRNGSGFPRTRYGQSAALDSRGRVIVSHGFSDQGRFDDTWAFDPASATWTNLTPPGGPRPLKRCLHELAYDPATDRIFLHGGCSSGFGPCPQGDLWAFDLKSNSWSEMTSQGAKPTPRQNPSFAYDSTGKRLYIFGGETSAGPSAEAWSYDLAGSTWSRVEVPSAPAARTSQGTAPDPMGRRILIFGGQAPDATLKDIWEWKFEVP
jgi:hypothetical protein